MRDLRQQPSEGQGGRRAAASDPFDAADAVSGSDLFLSPHADDICFSLGALAFRRRAGTLLTVFSSSSYIAPAQRWRITHPEETTQIRQAEDAAFASSCGLAMRTFGLDDAMARGRDVFDLSAAEEDTSWLEEHLVPTLFDLAGETAEDIARPWLFCPAGIGGHIDHVILRSVVARNIEPLMRRWRVCFYEDIFYAAEPMARFSGLHRLTQALPGYGLARRSCVLAELTARKLDLIGLYESQFDTLPKNIGDFTPATGSSDAPHEAVWVARKSGP
ncbi:MAG TPA: PIG-L family deacetylase [Parvibaculum sp.]